MATNPSNPSRYLGGNPPDKPDTFGANPYIADPNAQGERRTPGGGGGGGGGSGVTLVTATPPIASSGGTTPNISHLPSGVTAASYGDATHVSQFTVDADGHVTLAANVAITGFTPNAITALTGDGTATGPGSVPFTLATVNSNVGSFGDSSHVGQFTVNGKGLVTAASSVAISASAIGAITSITSTAGTITPTGTTTVNVDITGLPPVDSTDLGSTTRRWRDVYIASGRSIIWYTGSGSNTAGYLDGTGPFWNDRATGFGLDFNVQSLTATRTATWPNVGGTVAVDTPTNNNILIGNGTRWVSSAIPGPSGTAGGDLSGTYPNPTVAKINTVALGTTTATAGNLLIGSGSAWVTNAMSGDAAISSSGTLTLSAGQRIYHGTAAGTNTYTTTATPAPSAYTTNDNYVVTFTNANTGAATFNANSLGAKAIQFKGAALTGAEIAAGATVALVYDGTQFQIVDRGASGSSGVTSITAGQGLTGGTITTTGTLTVDARFLWVFG